jgi:hypothetical protein
MAYGDQLEKAQGNFTFTFTFLWVGSKGTAFLYITACSTDIMYDIVQLVTVCPKIMIAGTPKLYV